MTSHFLGYLPVFSRVLLSIVLKSASSRYNIVNIISIYHILKVPKLKFCIKVEAMDPDAGENGQVTYQIVRTEPVTASSLFTIDKDTGYISTAAEIDRETYEK